MTELASEVAERLRARGAGLIGFADLSPVDAETRRGFSRAVSFGVPLVPRIVASIRTGPTEEYCCEYDQRNAQLTAMAQEAAEFLESRGWRSQARPATGDWDRTTIRAPFQQKTAATLAGLGWIGKCALLVTPEYGSAVRWSTVLTDAPLPVGVAQTESRCGSCTACVDICPGHACSGKEWRQGMPREEFWDHRACMRGMAAVSAGRSNHIGICGMCIAACPHTQAYLRRAGAM